jgi:hypothetical protein
MTHGIPLADAGKLRAGARRSLAIRATALALLVAAVGMLVATTASATGGSSDAANGSSTVVVLDLSGSIDSSASATIIRTLRSVARGGGRAGLVLFSDSTEEAVPPTAPASLLRGYVRLFHATEPGAAFQDPWSLDFSDGTQIGKGLRAAREALARAGIHRGRVILVSDLADSNPDLPLLRRQVAAFAHGSISLRIAAVPGASRAELSYVGRALGGNARTADAPTAPNRDREGMLLAVLLAAAAIVLYGVHELRFAPLAWQEATS